MYSKIYAFELYSSVRSDKYVHPLHHFHHDRLCCRTFPAPETIRFKSFPFDLLTTPSFQAATQLLYPSFRLGFSRVSFKQNPTYVVWCLASCAQHNV